MVLYNICGRIFDPRLIDTDSRRMEQICNSYIVQICTDHIYDSEVCSKAEGGSRGTFSQGVANGLSHVVYRPGLIVRGVFSTATKVVIEVLRKEEGEFERSTCMGCVVSNRRVETAIALY